MRYIILALAMGSGAAQAEKDTFGLHMGTYHSPNIECSNGQNPGMYYHNGDSGIAIGTYYNSCKRQSEYVGWKTPDAYGFAVMFVGVTGYVKPVTLMIAPTFELNTTRFVKDSSIRITGGSWARMDVYHLSVERRF